MDENMKFDAVVDELGMENSVDLFDEVEKFQSFLLNAEETFDDMTNEFRKTLKVINIIIEKLKTEIIDGQIPQTNSNGDIIPIEPDDILRQIEVFTKLIDAKNRTVMDTATLTQKKRDTVYKEKKGESKGSVPRKRLTATELKAELKKPDGGGLG